MKHDRERRWADLLRQGNRGNREAYNQFLNEIAPILRGVIMARNGGRTDDSEDILQNTLIAIHEKRHTWRETDPVSAWLYAIARYKAADAWRARARRHAEMFDGEEALVEDPYATDPSIAHDLETLLTRLDGASATIVREMRLEGSSAEETGTRLGMTAGAVRVALHRALAKLSFFASEENVSPATDRRPKQ